MVKVTCLFRLFQVDALEAFQLFHGAGNAAHQVADIELYDFICIVVTRIGYGYGSSQFAVRIQLLGAERDVTVLEGGVAQAIAERIQRVVAHIQVVAELLEPFAFSEGRPVFLWLYAIGNWPTFCGKVVVSLPLGQTSPNTTSAMASAASLPPNHIQDGGEHFHSPKSALRDVRRTIPILRVYPFQQCFQQVALCVRHFQFGTAAAHHSSRRTRRGRLR